MRTMTRPALAAVAAVAFAAASAVAVPGVAEAKATCDGLLATIEGTHGPDRIEGTDGPDVIAALGGNDLVLAKGGNDVVCDGVGRDIVKGGSGDDVFVAETTPDENDNYYGDTGTEDLVSYERRTTAVWAEHRQLKPTTASPTPSTTRSRARSRTSSGGQRNDTLVGNDHANAWTAADGNDQIDGADGDDNLFGATGNDEVTTGLLLHTSSGSDGRLTCADVRADRHGRRLGSSGIDTVTYPNRAARVTVKLDGGPGDGALNEGDNVRTDVENVYGGRGPRLPPGWPARTPVGSPHVFPAMVRQRHHHRDRRPGRRRLGRGRPRRRRHRRPTPRTTRIDCES